MTAESSQLFHRVRYRVSNRNRSQLLAMATPMLFYKTFKHTDSRLEDMTAYLTEQLKDSTDFTVSMTVMRKGAPHELLKPWEDAEDSNINKTILAYYISMLSIINTEYNDDSSRHIMLNAYVERFSIQEVMDVLRCLLHSLSTGVIPSEWRVHFPTPELAQKKLRMDVDALLAIPENYTAYIEKTAEQVMASPKQVMPPAKPEAKQGSYHTLLKSWDAAENSNINKIIQYYYIFMLSIIKSKYNDDE
jgi:hypothetical protein